MDGRLAIRLRGVKRYGAITAVNRLDLDVPEGTCVGLLGPNGAGKVDDDAAPHRPVDRRRGRVGGARQQGLRLRQENAGEN